MLHTLKLLFPVFIPSWRFFNTIGPSPRIEFTLRTRVEDESSNWQELCLRPKQLSTISVVKSIFFNPRWNESLFIMTCAERLITNPTEHSIEEITNHIKAELERKEVNLKNSPYLQFRLVFISKQGNELQKQILFTSEIKNISGDAE